MISADREVKRIKAGKPFVSPTDGWFYPDAIHNDIAEELGRRL